VPSLPLPRRTVLRAGTALAVSVPLAGCGLLDTGPAAPDPVTEVLRALWGRERGLVTHYDAAIAALPSLRATLAPVRADHAAHADAVRAVLDARGPRATPSPSRPDAAPPGPGDRATVLAGLARAEAGARTAATAAALLAEGDTAALLASIAACESTHLVVLR
jgi:hypothetical protein